MIIGEAGSSSSDGRGLEAAPGEREAKPAHRYIYYRLYTKDGAIESNNPIYANDRFISRILSKSVAPPHTGASLKRNLCRVEGFPSPGNGVLYLSLSAKTTLEDSARLSLRGNTGPGSSETEPMALIVEISSVEERSAASTLDLETLLERREKPCYVHYHVYDKDGEVASKTSFNETDSCLGRINTLSIPPPHNIASLRSHLIKVEELSSPDVQLFEDDCGETSMKDSDVISFSSDYYPGIMEDEPIAIVYDAQKSSSELQLPDSAPHQDSAFSKQIVGSHAAGNWVSPDPTWHSRAVGEIFQTDGILRVEKRNHESQVYENECYLAINSVGKKAFLWVGAVDFC